MKAPVWLENVFPVISVHVAYTKLILIGSCSAGYFCWSAEVASFTGLMCCTGCGGVKTCCFGGPFWISSVISGGIRCSSGNNVVVPL